MHYKNGRPAKNGDKIVSLTYGFAGILHSAVSTSNSCNGRIAPISQNDPYITIKECLHIDDIIAAEIPPPPAEKND
jgi:hypothetical protein